MGVCAQQHRITTGRYNSFYFNKIVNKFKEYMGVGKALTTFLSMVGLILYLYIVCLLMALYIDVSKMGIPPTIKLSH